MARKILYVVAFIGLSLALLAYVVTRPGELVTPTGSSTITVDGQTFEAFPLPDYVTSIAGGDYLSYLIEVEPGIKIHMLEVGRGFPLFLQHGNPTSGLLYRKVADALGNEQFRILMPTLAGLGFSSKIPTHQHTVENHVRWINQALSQLEIKELIFVGQDWGGPIGMGALAESPELLKGAVMLNTGLNAPREARDLSRAHALAKSPITGEILLEVVVSVFSQMHQAQGDPSSLPPEVVALYEQPLETAGNKKAPLTMMRMVPDSPLHPSAESMRKIESYTQTLDIPVEIVWGMNDPILGKALPVMKANFPDAPVTETAAGHFLQEEVPQEIAEAIQRVYARTLPDASMADSAATSAK